MAIKMQTNRLFEIIYILLNKKTVTARELAERLGVSQRTIYRDLDVLSLAGIPVYTEKGKGGGISLLPEFVLDKSILSEQEQTEILTALQSLSGVTTADTDRVLRKLSAVFNRSAAHWLEVDFSDWSWQNGNVFNDFKTAILERRIAEFDYYSTYGEKTRRRAEPIRLWFKHRAWYVNCFCLTRQDVRLFKLSRVRNLTVTDEHFSKRDILAGSTGPEPAAHLKQDVTLKFRIAPEMTWRVFDDFDETVAERQSDGGYIVTVTFPEDDWVYGMLLSYGEYIEVLGPTRVREAIREKARKFNALVRVDIKSYQRFSRRP